MGRIFKFAKTEYQYSGQNAKPKYMVIEFLPEQVGTLTYTGQELFPTWKNLDPLKVTIDGEVSATTAGKHYITVTPTGIFAWPDMTQTPKQIEYVIERAVIDKVPTQKGTLTFNNAQQSPEWNDFDASVMTVGGVYENQLHAGTYTATFTPDDNHCWRDGTFSAVNADWEIEKLTLAKPALTSTTYPYTGAVITPTITNFNANFMSKAGDTSATNVANNYKITFSLLYPDDSEWTGGSIADFDINWQITKVTLAKVTANTTTLTYNTQSQEPAWANFNATYINKTGDGANISAGTYTTTFSLKDPVNTSWADGSTGDITFTWKIEKLKLMKVTAPNLNLTYNAQNQEPAWQNYNTTYIYTKWGSDGAKRDAGSYKTTFGLIDTDNTSWTDGSTADIEFSWKIDKLKVAKVTASNLELTYNGNAQEPAWQNYNATYIDKHGDGANTNAKWSGTGWEATLESYNTWFDLKDSTNTCWSDGTTGYCDLYWKINPAKVKNPTFKGATIFTSDGVTVDESCFNNIESSKGVELDEKKTYYEPTTATARFEAWDYNYAFSSGSTYKHYYDITITVTDARFPFTWTDTDGNQQTANNQTELENKFPFTNTISRSSTTKFTVDSSWSAYTGNKVRIATGEVNLTSSSGGKKVYSAVSSASTSSGLASMQVELIKNTGAKLYAHVHIYI